MLPVEKRESIDKERGESAPLGGEGGAARVETKYRSDGYKYHRRCSYEERRRAVRLYMEEGMPADLVAREIGVCHGSIFEWVRQYRESGEAGLKPKPYGHRTINTSNPVSEKITAIKKNNPRFGSKRISQILRRMFLFSVSPETVRKRLKKEGLGTPRKKARKKPEPKIHFFERSAPNETWQSDISTVQILGKNAYVIAFIDDYSRYIVSHGLFRSQTAEYVMDVYRTAVGTYGIPKEMLTDNGRQYASWRGTSKFGKELKKDHVHHIRSQPHHPQTLGKIERFWKTLKEEFLDRARFETFEEAQERVKFWIKYYNHQRPHQGIGGVCPADRYFSVQKELKQVIEKGVEENAEELALRGIPMKPFYMVGQMGDQSVVLRSEKGKLRMMVGGEEGKEMVYDLGKDGNENSEEKTGMEGIQRKGEMQSGLVALVGAKNALGVVQRDGNELGGVARVGESCAGRDHGGAGSGVEERRSGGDQAGKADREVAGEGGGGACGRTGGAESTVKGGMVHENGRTGKHVEGGREMPCSPGNMDGTQEGHGNPPGDGGEREFAGSVAGTGDGRDVGGLGTARQEGIGGRAGAGKQGKEVAGKEGTAAGEWLHAEDGEEVVEVAGGEGGGIGIDGRGTDERVNGGSEGTGTNPAGNTGTERAVDGHGVGGEDGSEPQDVLQVGEKMPSGDDGGGERERRGTALAGSGSGEGGSETGERRTEERCALVGAETSHT